jgi:hypothetical protein
MVGQWFYNCRKWKCIENGLPEFLNFNNKKYKTMKKLILSFAFIGLFSFTTLTNATPIPDQNGCHTETYTCADGTQHYVVICDDDWGIWEGLLCNDYV